LLGGRVGIGGNVRQTAEVDLVPGQALDEQDQGSQVGIGDRWVIWVGAPE
jgi:hypothetical protein